MLAKLKQTFAGPIHPDAVATALSKARAEFDAAMAAYDASQAKYTASIAEENPTGAMTAKSAVDEAHVNLEISKARISRLERELEEARAAAAEAKRVSDYEAAKSARAGAVNRLKKDYEKAASALVSIARQIADADALIAQANTDLPTEADVLATVEELARTRPAKPRKIVSQNTVRLWTFASNGNRVNENHGYRLQASGDTGFLQPPHGGEVIYVQKRNFTETHFVEGRPELRAAPLAEALRIPALMAGDPDLFPLDIRAAGATTSDQEPIEVSYDPT